MANYNAIQVGLLIKEFARGGTCKEIATRTGYNYCTVMRYARIWHKQGVVYVDRWKRDTGLKPVRVLRLNTDNMTDCPKPEPMTRAEIEFRRKMKKAGATKRVMMQLRRAA